MSRQKKSGHAVAGVRTQVKPGMEAATGDRPSAGTLSRIARRHGWSDMMRVSLGYRHRREGTAIVKEKVRLSELRGTDECMGYQL